MKTCAACGMPLTKKEDYFNNDESSNFCIYCVNENGKVKSGEEIFEGGVQFFMNQIGTDRQTAEKFIRKNMCNQSYWQKNPCEILNGDMATDSEFKEMMKKM